MAGILGEPPQLGKGSALWGWTGAGMVLALGAGAGLALEARGPVGVGQEPQAAWLLVNGVSQPPLLGLSRQAQLQRLRGPERLAHLQALAATLRAGGAQRVTTLWLPGAVSFVASSAQVEALRRLSLPAGASIQPDQAIMLPRLQQGGAEEMPGSMQVDAARWNLDQLNAPALWAEGGTGGGAVVASLDSGADGEHQALQGGFRGGAADWLNLVDASPAPVDDTGHGTASLALAVGRDIGGSPLGVAPGASWIAARMFKNGSSSMSLAHAALQWVLDPDGNAATDDAPDVVLLSWWLEGSTQVCVHDLDTDLDALLAAGIAVVAAAGNTGPGAATSVSPASHPGVLSVGAVDAGMTLASFSALGPSACGGDYPSFVAAGVTVETADLSLGGILPTALTSVSGTSFAAPHVAGALALLRESAPGAAVSSLAQALAESSVDLGVAGVDSSYGVGLPNIWLAVQGVPQDLPPVGGEDTASARRGRSISIAVLQNDLDPEGALVPDSVRLERPPTQGTAVVLEGGLIGYTAGRTARGSDSLTYSVSDAGGQNSGPVLVTVQIQSR